jgi:hypothetical protein
MSRRAPGAHSSVEPASVGVAMLFGGLIEDGDRYRIDRTGALFADASFMLEGDALVIRPGSAGRRPVTLSTTTVIR